MKTETKEFADGGQDKGHFIPWMKAGQALVIFVAFVVFQFIGSLVTVFLYSLIRAFQGHNFQEPAAATTMMQDMMGPVILGSVLFSGIATITLSAFWFRDELRNCGPEGGAWVIGSARPIAAGLLIGMVLGVAYMVCCILFTPPDITLGPLAKMAVTPGCPQLIWSILAVVIAPPIEELLFRGVIFGGLCRSWGILWAAVASTAVFVLLHLSEMVHFWPAAIFITLMALAALRLRLKARAVGPAVAAHFGYNGVLAILVTFSTFS